MDYIKELLLPLLACYIGPALFDGVNWFIYKDEPFKDRKILELTQQIIKAGQRVSDIITIKQIENGKVVIINEQIFKELVNIVLNKFYIQNPNFPRIANGLQIDQIKEMEKQELVQYIASLPLMTNDIDIYLYKSYGERIETLLLHENDKIYKKRIYGFYLTETNIESINRYLIQYNRKISKIEEKECIDPINGIRYTLYLTDADILN